MKTQSTMNTTNTDTDTTGIVYAGDVVKAVLLQAKAEWERGSVWGARKECFDALEIAKNHGLKIEVRVCRILLAKLAEVCDTTR